VKTVAVKSGAAVALRICGAYLFVIGSISILAPGALSGFVQVGHDPTCYPWIQYIGPMAISIGAANYLAARSPCQYLAVILGLLFLTILQTGFDLYLVVTNRFSWIITADTVLMTVSAIAAWTSVNFLEYAPYSNGGYPLYLRLSKAILTAYLVLGGTCALILPSLMNQVLNYTLAPSCTPWVQFTGPLSLALALTFGLAGVRPRFSLASILPLAFIACVTELALDAWSLANGSFKRWPIIADVIIVLPFAASLVARFFVSGTKELNTSFRTN
jgi:hypothetical protein